MAATLGRLYVAFCHRSADLSLGRPNMTKTLNQDCLAKFTCSEQLYRHAINRKVVFTDGVKYVADQAGAYWLLDEIALVQSGDRRVIGESFQVWQLTVNGDETATLTCEDGNKNVLYAKRIEFTDFPQAGITLWYTNNTILLPSEY
jgi:hypothetical protein